MKATLLAATLAVLLGAASAAAADRTVVVNGQLLAPEQVALLDSLACTRVPTGRYWLLPNGAWGYEGFPVIAGFVGDQCGGPVAAPGPRQKSLSERGLLYSPGELLR
jgi:hypothetical protein